MGTWNAEVELWIEKTGHVLDEIIRDILNPQEPATLVALRIAFNTGVTLDTHIQNACDAAGLYSESFYKSCSELIRLAEKNNSPSAEN